MARRKSDKLSKPVGNVNNLNRSGRKPGSVNKSTANAREAIAAFVDANAERLQEWLDQIAETDGPKAAFQCLMDVIEYHVPKLARTEVTGKDGGAIEGKQEITVTFVRPDGK